MNAPTVTTAQREDVRARIVAVAMNAFHTRGIKSVTMDEIAHRLSMSKRTLYQIFADKEDLLLACAVQQHELESKQMYSLYEQSENVMDTLLATFARKMQEMEQIKPCFFAEIGKYPRVVEYFQRIRKAQEDEAVSYLEQGIVQGFFRPDVNFRIVYGQLMNGFDSLMNSSVVRAYSQQEIFLNTAVTYIRGCATLRGIELIDKFLASQLGKLRL